MLRMLFSGVSGLRTHQVRLDVIGNNVANINTTAFKASRARFEDILSQTTEGATAPEAGRGGQNPIQVGLGVQGAFIARDMAQGQIETTGRETDLAIEGNGFFIVRDGETPAKYYTRDGSFEIDRDGNLVRSSNGYRVQGWNASFDSFSKEWVIDESQPVEDIEINLFQQFEPNATSKVAFSGNLDSDQEMALDPIRVGWTKNGQSREIEIRFTHAHPTERIFLYEAYDPTVIDPSTGDFRKITTGADGIEIAGLVKLDNEGRVIAHYVNTADDDPADPATKLITNSAEEPTDADLWAIARPQNTFNGYDFFTLSTGNDGDVVQQEENARSNTQTIDTTGAAPEVTLTLPHAPFASQASGAAVPNYPNGFTQDGIFQTPAARTAAGLPILTNTGDVTVPGDGLGVPIQYVEAVANEVVDNIGDAAPGSLPVGSSNLRRILQLDHTNIIDSQRLNPDESGNMSLSGTDKDSLKLYIDGVEWTRVATTAQFTAGGNQYTLDPNQGKITLSRPLPNGINAVVSYQHEVRPTNTTTLLSRTMTEAFGGILAPNIRTMATDGSYWYNSGSASTWQITNAATSTTENFTEIPWQSGAAPAPGPNQFWVNPTTGAITFGTYSDGVTAIAANDLINGTFETFRRQTAETDITVAAGTTTAAVQAAINRNPGGGIYSYMAGSVGSLEISGPFTQSFQEVTWYPGITPGPNQFAVDPSTNTITFGTYADGVTAVGAADTLVNAETFKVYGFSWEEGGVEQNGLLGSGNAFGQNDMFRMLKLNNGSAERGEVQIWLQGDGVDAAGNARTLGAQTISRYLPAIDSTLIPQRWAEANYESDDRVNIIIPSGLTKTPNTDPLKDKTPEAFNIGPNITQITGNSGNNNQANSGDTVGVNLKSQADYMYSTSIEVYDSLGKSWNIPVKFERIDTNLWIVYAQDPTDTNDPPRLAGYRLVAFDEKGRYDQTNSIPFESPVADGTTNDGFLGIYFDPAQAGGAGPPERGAAPVQITLDLGNLFQTAVNNDAVGRNVDGYPPGDLSSYSFNEEGFLVGLFSNGLSRNLSRVALQNFVNPAGLLHVGRNMFVDSVNAGKIGSPARPGFDGSGTLQARALEASNVDLSVEFVDMIITQRGFQAQSRSITTGDQILQELLTLKR